jgi:hypothetical protein
LLPEKADVLALILADLASAWRCRGNRVGGAAGDAKEMIFVHQNVTVNRAVEFARAVASATPPQLIIRRAIMQPQPATGSSADHSVWIWIYLAGLLVLAVVIAFGSLALTSLNEQQLASPSGTPNTPPAPNTAPATHTK